MEILQTLQSIEQIEMKSNKEDDGSITFFSYSFCSTSNLVCNTYHELHILENDYSKKLQEFVTLINNVDLPINIYTQEDAYNYIQSINNKFTKDKRFNAYISVQNVEIDKQALENKLPNPNKSRVYLHVHLIGN